MHPLILRPRALFYRTDCTRRSKFLTHALHIKEESEESEEFDDLDENIEHTDRYPGNYKDVGNDEENGHFIKFENLSEIGGDFR